MTNQEPHFEFGDNTETEIEEFYASLESLDTHFPSLKSTRPSEKTKKAIHTLQVLLSKQFSLLLHPGRSIEMKDTLKYLLTLPQNEVFSMTTRIEIQKMLQCFEQWSLEYHNAGLSASAELSKANEVMYDLEANVKEFQVLDKEDKYLCNQLVCLQEQKRVLEKKIKIINVQIENSTRRRDKVAQGKTVLFDKGKTLKANWYDMRIHLPRLRAEQELADKTRYNIDAEWFKLRQHFIRSTGFKEWILGSPDTSKC